DAADIARPGDLQRAVHQEARGAGADEFCGDAEIEQLAFAVHAEVELKQAFILAIDDQPVELDPGRVNAPGEIGVIEPAAGNPQPFLADAAVEIAIPVERGRLDLA
ncbi:hypothetical protein SB7C_12225, partial [Staphylococcus epidermidis]